MQNDTQHDERTGAVGPPAASGGPMPQAAPAEARRRDLPFKIPFLAGFLSGLFPGVGQLYVGYYRDGISLGILTAAVITMLATGEVSPLEPFLGISLFFIYLYGIIDAARKAQAVNRHLDGIGTDPLPTDLAALGGGSIFGGVVLVILGVIMLLHTRFAMDMQWLADWWPLALVGLGGWLIWQARRERKG